jgi:glycosyltransferase involved in cell wall biosynthesis
MISVIIPSANSVIIDRVIGALLRQTAQQVLAEIIVVGQDARRLVPRSSPVRFIHTARVLSIGEARNLGARLASGDYLLFLDADCIAVEQLRPTRPS